MSKQDDMEIHSEEDMLRAMDMYQEDRRARLLRHKVPATRDLQHTLTAMTRDELNDICANLNVHGTSSLRKAELVEKLVPEVVKFAKTWWPTMLLPQYEFFAQMQAEDLVLGEDEAYDYLRALGLVGCGAQDGKLTWYLPQEISSLFATSQQEQRTRAERNTELGRLAAGLLYYFGYLDFEDLYRRVCTYVEGTADSITHFVGVLMNLSAWEDSLHLEHEGACYGALVDPDDLGYELSKREQVTPVQLTREQVWAAGERDYASRGGAAQPVYECLERLGVKVVGPRDGFTSNLYDCLQNGGTLQQFLAAMQENNYLQLTKEQWQELLPVLVAYNNSLPLWMLKGHTPDEIAQTQAGQGKVVSFSEHMQRHQKVGRNDPCPCGSGKKYKNCCLRKDEL